MATQTQSPRHGHRNGCVGYIERFEGPANPDDCGKDAADIHKHFVQNGIPIVWWALEKERTIYLRTKADCRPYQKNYCDHWVQLGKNPDPHLFRGLNLNLP